jgi:hypothetical protein
VVWGLSLAAFAFASPVVLAHGNEVTGARTLHDVVPVASSSPRGELASSVCEHAVVVLLEDDLSRVSAGQPDVSASAVAGLPDYLGGEQSSAFATVHRIHDQIVGSATTDLINVYGRDVQALLAAYSPRVASACAAVSD